MIRFISRQGIWQAALLALLSLPLAGAGIYVWHKHRWAQDRLAELEPRHARLLGLLQRQTDFAAGLQTVEQYLAANVYPAEQSASQAGNDAQQRIRDLFSESGLNVVSVQVQAVREEGAFDRVPIALRAEGDLPALHRALARLQAQSPTVTTESVSVQTVGAVRPGTQPKLAAQFSFFVLRARS